MSRREVQFGLGDLASRMADLAPPGDLADESGQPVVGSAKRVYLHMGQLFVSADPRFVSTVLGSCVAVCLWDPALRAGGLNHYLLPQRVENGISTPRFGNVAIARLIEDMLRLGSLVKRLKAKVFGGASIIDAFENRSLGMENVVLARECLVEAGIPIVAEDVGGHQGRKLLFQTDSGTAWVRRI